MSYGMLYSTRYFYIIFVLSHWSLMLLRIFFKKKQKGSHKSLVLKRVKKILTVLFSLSFLYQISTRRI
jgi:hypothetical protein